MSTNTSFFFRFVIYCFFLISPFILSAQHYEHATFWSRIAVAAPLSKKWEFQFEYVHRSQNNFRESKWNPLAHEVLEEPRLWINYKQKHYSLMFNFLTFFYSEPLLAKESDFNIKPNITWQTAVAFEANQTAKKWTFKERAIYEYRFLKSLNYVPVGRVRLRALVQYALTNKTKLQAYNDVFLNAPPHKLPKLLDQNWSLVGISHQFSHKLTMELGYMRNHRIRPNRIEFDEENAINLGLNIKL